MLAERNAILVTTFQEMFLCILLIELLHNDCGLRYSGNYSWYLNFSLHCVFKLIRICIVIYAALVVVPTFCSAMYKNIISSDFTLAKHNLKKDELDYTWWLTINYTFSWLCAPAITCYSAYVFCNELSKVCDRPTSIVDFVCG